MDIAAILVIEDLDYLSKDVRYLLTIPYWASCHAPAQCAVSIVNQREIYEGDAGGADATG